MTPRARCNAAIDLHRGVERWIASLPPAIAAGSASRSARISARSSPPASARSHQHITATGDTVNVASRLMEVAAQNSARLALSDTLLDAADFHGAPDGVLSGPLLTQVRGRSGVVTVWFWRDQDRPSQAAAKAEMID